MKNITLLFAICLFAFTQSIAQNVDLPQASKPAMVSEDIGLSTVKISYHRPGVRGREGKIWGTPIVPYGEVWRAGANENTVIYFENDVTIEGKPLAAGKYGFHLIPTESQWTLIFSKNSASWGSYFYKPEEDALRVTVKPEACAYQEFLKYEFTNQTDNAARVELSWEKVKGGFTVAVDLNKTVVASLRDQLRGTDGFTWEAHNQAARYCADNNTNLEEALQWIDLAISESPYFAQKSFTTLQTKSMILDKMGKADVAKQMMDEAVAMSTMQELHFYARNLSEQGKAEEGMKMFEMNRKRNPTDNFTTLVGLARGNMGMKNYKEAAKYFRMAAPNAPKGQQEVYEKLAKDMDTKVKS